MVGGPRDVARTEFTQEQLASPRHRRWRTHSGGAWPVSLSRREALAVFHLIGLGGASAVLAAEPISARDAAELPIWLGIAVAFAVLRMASIGRRVGMTMVLFDAIGTAIFMAGTGGAGSPFTLFVIVGAWWAANAVDGRGWLYGMAFGLAYLVLVAPIALPAGDAAAIVYQPATVLIVAILLDRLLAMRRATTRDAFSAIDAELGVDDEVLVRGLSRAMPSSDVPVHALLTARRLGLTAHQTELIAYLVLGLTNQEIADAMGVSEATVRYRLTPLYRSLGVRGRKAAAERARQLGLDALIHVTRRPAA
jgi:DNA-binding CsgD family transcriptional regulator